VEAETATLGAVRPLVADLFNAGEAESEMCFREGGVAGGDSICKIKHTVCFKLNDLMIQCLHQYVVHQEHKENLTKGYSASTFMT